MLYSAIYPTIYQWGAKVTGNPQGGMTVPIPSFSGDCLIYVAATMWKDPANSPNNPNGQWGSWTFPTGWRSEAFGGSGRGHIGAWSRRYPRFFGTGTPTPASVTITYTPFSADTPPVTAEMVALVVGGLRWRDDNLAGGYAVQNPSQPRDGETWALYSWGSPDTTLWPVAPGGPTPAAEQTTAVGSAIYHWGSDLQRVLGAPTYQFIGTPGTDVSLMHWLPTEVRPFTTAFASECVNDGSELIRITNFQWMDQTSNESGFNIWRTGNADRGEFAPVLMDTVGPNVTSWSSPPGMPLYAYWAGYGVWAEAIDPTGGYNWQGGNWSGYSAPATPTRCTIRCEVYHT